MKRSPNTNAEDLDVACYSDVFGAIYTRGHVTITAGFPTTASSNENAGGKLIAYLPKGSGGQCDCTPVDHDIYATTTVLATPFATSTEQLCTARIRISAKVPEDVNNDGAITNLDVTSITGHLDFGTGSACAACADQDVNGDGFLDSKDTDQVSASATFDQNVPCGSIHILSTTCGALLSSTVRWISLDSIFYFSEDGVAEVGVPLKRDANPSQAGLEVVLKKIASLENDNAKLRQSLEETDGKLEARSSSTKSIVVDVFVSIGAVVVCGVILFFVQRRRAYQ